MSRICKFYFTYLMGRAINVGTWNRRFGRLPMAELLAPAARAAREGEPVPQVIAGYWAGGAEG